jgi:AcrR family transcriptional regulator
MPAQRDHPPGAVGATEVAGLSARQRIVAGARKHFFAHGFRGVTMDDLAAELAMSKKTLYAHFRSKPAIVEAMILDKFSEIEAEFARIETEHGSEFPEALRELLACLQRHVAEIQPSFVRDMQRTAPALFKSVEIRRAALIERYFGRLFANGRKEGMVRKDVPARLAIEILLSAIQAIANPQKLAELGLTPQATIPAIISVILEGVLTAAGRKNQ